MGENSEEEMKLRGKRTQKILSVFILLALLTGPLLYLFTPEMLVWLGSILVTDMEAVAVDAIVVLGGGGPSRPREAADLFRSGLSQRVILTTQEDPDGYAELNRMGIQLYRPYENSRRILVGLGVPAESIQRIENPVSHTISELREIRDFASRQDWNRLILVTSNYHTRRTQLTSRHVFSGKWQVAVVGSRYDTFSPNNWWQEPRHVRIFLIEFQKLIAYEFYLNLFFWS